MSRFELDRSAVASVVSDLDPAAPSYRVAQLWDGLHRRFLDPSELTDLPRSLRAALGDHPALAPALVEERSWESDGGATRKWVWRLTDGARVETVLMRYANRATVCVSSQAGCAMGCGFCATGQAGFTRHLRIGEIVEQVVRASREAGGLVSGVVFMGMGEPLANYDATVGAVRRIHGDLGISARHLTVSTVGIVPGIRRLAGEGLPLTLAVSLHAADDGLRDEHVPINRRYPLASVAAACEYWLEQTGRRVSFEWALMGGVNDRRSDAEALARFAGPLRAHVNLIPLNPTPGFAVPGSPPARVREFRSWLVASGINTTIRDTRGRDIDAACGQLAARMSN
jgi:23S rRNA (adenine2503-C2)-methyltransferase